MTGPLNRGRTPAGQPYQLFEPSDLTRLLEGWLLHAHKARDRHERAARQNEWRRVYLGVPAIAFSALVSTSVFAAIQGSPDAWVAAVVALIAVTAAILTALQTFLDYAGRAAKHHATAARYKGIVWELEQALSRKNGSSVDPKWVDNLRERLAALEEAAPVVGNRLWKAVERDYTDVSVVRSIAAAAGMADGVAAATPPGPAIGAPAPSSGTSDVVNEA